MRQIKLGAGTGKIAWMAKVCAVFFLWAAAAVACLRDNKLHPTVSLPVQISTQLRACPLAGLVQATGGKRYGTASSGGANNQGTVFTISPSGTLTACTASMGRTVPNPSGELIQSTDGNFYGATGYGGHGYGTVFKITPNGTLTTLYSSVSKRLPGR